MSRLMKKVAVVTGAASGLGKEVSHQFVEQGIDRVYLCDLNIEACEAISRELGDRATPVLLDVTVERDWEVCLARVIEEAGQLDVLVNSAGILGFNSIEEETLENWNRIQSVNATGVFLGCKHGVRTMKEHSRAGSIINLASAASLDPASGALAYAASKFTVRGITIATAKHCGEKNYPIRCNSIHPGVVDTPMMHAALAEGQSVDDMLQSFADGTLVGRTAKVQEIAQSIIYFASDESSFVTGSPFVIDGGYSVM